VFVIKWNANGTLAGYSPIKGSLVDIGRGIAVDSSQNIYITGQYNSTAAAPINTFGLSPALTGVSLPATVGTDGFVIKWNANGTLAGYTTIKGNSTDIGYGIAVDSSQNIYVIGTYSSAATVPINTFGLSPALTGSSLPITTGNDVFVIKWNANGTLAGYSTIKGNNSDLGRGIAVDSSQNIYITGQYVSSATVPINTFGLSPALTGSSLPITTIGDVFVIKWNANGTLAGYSTINPSGSDVGYSIAIDSSGNIYITGSYSSTATVPINTFRTAPTATGVSLPVTVGTDGFVIKWVPQ
jgi:hypothetical protein